MPDTCHLIVCNPALRCAHRERDRVTTNSNANSVARLYYLYDRRPILHVGRDVSIGLTVTRARHCALEARKRSYSMYDDRDLRLAPNIELGTAAEPS